MRSIRLLSLFLIIIVITISPFKSRAQKKALDEEAYNNWLSIECEQISDDGKLVVYNICKPDTTVSLVIQPLDKSYRTEVCNALAGAKITSSNKVIFKLPNDTLAIFDSKKRTFKYKNNVSQYDLRGSGKGEIIFYRTGNTLKRLNLKTESEQIIADVETYLVSNSGNTVIVNFKGAVYWIDIRSNIRIELINGISLGAMAFSESENAFAGIVNKSGQPSFVVYFKQGMSKPAFLLTRLNTFEDEYKLSNSFIRFNNDEDVLFINLEKIEKPRLPASSISDLNVWSYKDISLQSAQLKTLQEKSNITLSVVDVLKDSAILFETQKGFFVNKAYANHYLLQYQLLNADKFYQKEGWPVMRLVSVLNGGAIAVTDQRTSGAGIGTLSPDEKFLVWYDNEERNYYSYDINRKATINLSAKLPFLTFDTNQFKMDRESDFGVGGWSEDNKSIFIYDKFDIWQIDPQGLLPARNITGGYGKKNNIVFGIINTEFKKPLKLNGELIISGFDMTTKMNGYFSVSINDGTLPDGVLKPEIYYIARVGIGDEFNSGLKPQKAKMSQVFLVRTMSATKAPNLSITTDFKNYRQITDVQPHKNHNWLTSELVNWKSLDGTAGEGILYKPENFDPTKKYPLIFDIYEKRSSQLNMFFYPSYEGQRIDIPTYVSNGYLVFVPDIHFPIKKPGEGVLNTVVSAARYLSGLKYVDSTRLGVQGHSFGGWETNYLITHCKLFTAACEASGVSNSVSAYGDLDGSGNSRNRHTELGTNGSPFGIGTTPWTDKETYINDAPIFNIGEVSTPLLMMHNKEDGQVPFGQAVEFFTGLRRAGKKVWLLQYDGCGHSAPPKDFSIRVMQFFDYYLKGKAAPKWMTVGIPAVNKGLDDGLELDEVGVEP